MFENNGYFEAIITHGSLSKAAKILGISQPALSNYLKQLETREKAVLFDRSSVPIVLTKAGEIYYKYLKQNEALKNNYINEMKDLSHVGTGTVVIGGASSTTACYLSRVTSEFLEKYPDSNVKILDGLVADIEKQALNGEVDFFISPGRLGSLEFDYIKLLEERIFVCIPTQKIKKLLDNANTKYNDPEMSREFTEQLVNRRIPIEDFVGGTSYGKKYKPIDGKIIADECFVLLEDGTNIRSISNAIFERWGIVPKNPVEVSQMLTGFNLCTSGAGITFLPESILRYGNFNKYPAIYALDESVSRRSMFACCKKGRYLSNASLEFIEMLKKALS